MNMKILLVSSVAFLFSAVAYASGGFVAAAGHQNGCTFATESAVSGYFKAENGMTLSHGFMPAVGNAVAGIEIVKDFCDETAPVEIYTLDGRFLLRTLSTEFDAVSLEPGIYIARKGAETIKFIKSTR